MGKDKREKNTEDILGMDYGQEDRAEEITPDGGSECTGEAKELWLLEEQLQKAGEERDMYLSMAQRLQAEFDNFRKRNRAAVSAAHQDSVYETVELFLPILDNLQRGLESPGNNESTQVHAIYKGVEMVTKQFTDILEKLGIEEIEALDQPFDPTYHNAVMQVEAEDEEQKNKVVEVLLKGYKGKDRVIRYSMVKVAI